MTRGFKRNFSDLRDADPASLHPAIAGFRENLIRAQEESGVDADEFWEGLDAVQPKFAQMATRSVIEKRMMKTRPS